MDPERKAFINSLLEHYQPKDAQDIQDMLKDLLGETLQGMLEAEMDDHLGYSKYDYKNKETDDSRNGYSPKTATSSMGTIDLDIPRDRKGDFEPQIVKKNQTDISNIEDQVLSMYAKGMTTRDISAHLKDVCHMRSSFSMSLLYHAYVYLEFLILACTIYILAPTRTIYNANEASAYAERCRLYRQRKMLWLS